MKFLCNSENIVLYTIVSVKELLFDVMLSNQRVSIILKRLRKKLINNEIKKTRRKSKIKFTYTLMHIIHEHIHIYTHTNFLVRRKFSHQIKVHKI